MFFSNLRNRFRKTDQIDTEKEDAEEVDDSMISPEDALLLQELRSRIAPELLLVPDYNDDYSLLRWLVGWDRKLDVIVPKMKFTLRAIHALGLSEVDLSTLESVTSHCDSISTPLQYLPGSLIGFDKDGNVVSLQAVGRLDASGLMQCLMNSDLYRMRIAESEGVMQVIREQERKMGKKLGTSVIFDLDGMRMSMLDVQAIKVITTMLAQLQEMFPDVLRKIFIVNAPSFIQVLWAAISPCLAKQTLQKIQFLGDNWKDRLREAIGEDVLFPHWGGTRPADSPTGFVRMGGPVPDSLKEEVAAEEKPSPLISLDVPARSIKTVSLHVEGDLEEGEERSIHWWWQIAGGNGDIFFSISRTPSTASDEQEDDVIWPRFKLQTIFVPEKGKTRALLAGEYKLIFDNTHSRFRSKSIQYSAQFRTGRND